MRSGRLVQATLALAALPFGLWLAGNVFLNVGLPALLNARPDALRIDYDYAWVDLGAHLTVRGLRIRAQSDSDQWLLTADDAGADVDLLALPDRAFVAEEVRADGVSFRYRRRADAPTDPSVTPGFDPDIPGLVNPPLVEPQAAGDAPPWRIHLGGVQVRRAREVWVGAARFTGDAQAAGTVELTPTRFVELPYANAWVASGQVTQGRGSVASGVTGRVVAKVEPFDFAAHPDGDLLPALSLSADVQARADDLGFLNAWLQDAPWIGLGGSAEHLAARGRLVGGRFLDGSALTAETRELVAHFLTYRITGDGSVRLAVEPAGGSSQSHLSVAFSRYDIRREGGQSPLVEGEGFRVTAHSPVVALRQPFSTLAVALDLPDSTIRDVTEYNAYLPADIGFSLRGGSGRVRGHMEATVPENRARGEMFLDGRGVRATFDDLTLTGDVGVRAHLADGWLDKGTYDMSGSSVQLADLRVATAAPARTPGAGASAGPAAAPDAAPAPGSPEVTPERKAKKGLPKWLQGKAKSTDEGRSPGLAPKKPARGLFGKLAQRAGQTAGWWARIEVPECHVQVGADIFLDARLDVRLRDTVPIITIFSRKTEMPDWVRGLMAVNDVSGSARIRLGDTRLELPQFQVRGGNFDVRLRLVRTGTVYRGVLFAAYGKLSLGAELLGEKIKLQVFDAKPWFEQHPPVE